MKAITDIALFVDSNITESQDDYMFRWKFNFNNHQNYNYGRSQKR